MSAFSRMEVLLATLVLILASFTHGGPISNLAGESTFLKPKAISGRYFKYQIVC